MTTDHPGHLYVLINPSMPGQIKVGFTTRDAEERAEELSSTGVPTPFIVAYQAHFAEVRAAEQAIHARLAPFRVNQGREFFRAKPTYAIDLILELRVQGQFGATGLMHDPVAQDKQALVKLQARDQAQTLYEQGLAYQEGRGVDKSLPEAIKYFQAAVKAGSPEAHGLLGEALLRGAGTAPDIKKGLRVLEQGAALNDPFCRRELAVAYRRQGQDVPSRNRWHEYFDATLPTEEAFFYAARLLMLQDIGLIQSLPFLKRHLDDVLRMWDLATFALFHVRARRRDPQIYAPLGHPIEALHDLTRDHNSDAAQLLEYFERSGLVNRSAVLHAAREMHQTPSRGRYATPAVQNGWQSWTEFDPNTGTHIPRPDRVPPELNNPFDTIERVSTPAFQSDYALWMSRYNGDGMQIQPPKRPKRR